MQFAGPATSLERSRIPRVEEGGEGEKKKKKNKTTNRPVTNGGRSPIVEDPSGVSSGDKR